MIEMMIVGLLIALRVVRSVPRSIFVIKRSIRLMSHLERSRKRNAKRNAKRNISKKDCSAKTISPRIKRANTFSKKYRLKMSLKMKGSFIEKN
jgi:hypothetical protein